MHPSMIAFALGALAACATPRDNVPAAESNAVVVQPHCGDGKVWAGKEECDDGNQDDNDLCSNHCVPFMANAMGAENPDDDGGMSGFNWEVWEARMKVNPSPNPIRTACFRGGKNSSAPQSLVNEVAKHLNRPVANLTPTLLSTNGKRRNAWFIKTKDCPMIGCFGSVFLKSDCANDGWCYAGTAAEYELPSQLKCLPVMTLLGDYNHWCEFHPHPKSCKPYFGNNESDGSER
jgi:cysteine-rich repeat protein